MPKCPQCEDGWKIEVEDGRTLRVACYHCGNTGEIPDEQLRSDKIRWMCESLALSVVAEWQKNPEWGLSAAEDGIPEREYYMGCVWGQTDRILREMETLSPSTVDALLRMWETNNQAVPSPNQGD